MARPLIFQVIKAPAKDLNCTQIQKAVLISYLDALNPKVNGTLAWPGLETIAAHWNIDEKTVRRAIAKLCELELLKLHRRLPRGAVYIIQTGVIHDLIVTGHSARSLDDSEPVSGHCVPVTGHSVQSDRAQSPPKYQGRTKESPIGSSATDDTEAPVQRQLAVNGLVADTTQACRSPTLEEPGGEKPDAREAREQAIAAAHGRRQA